MFVSFEEKHTFSEFPLFYVSIFFHSPGGMITDCRWLWYELLIFQKSVNIQITVAQHCGENEYINI